MDPKDLAALFGTIEVGAGTQSAPATQQAAEPAPEPPTLPQKATSFGTAMLKFASTGFRTVSQEVQDGRLQTCARCEHQSGNICLICGCFMGPKTSLPHEACPLGRWHAEP
jgi:hypothetical protein